VRRAGLLLAALLIGCGGSRSPEASAPIEPFDQAAIEQTWVWQIAFDASLDEALVVATASRWLTLEPEPEPAWQPIAWPVHPFLDDRRFAEDARALRELGSLYRLALCDLHEGNGLPSSMPDAAALAAVACDGSSADAAPWQAPADGGVLDGLAPTIDRTLEIHGETLRYRFQHPAQFDWAADLLDAGPLLRTDPLSRAGGSDFGGGIRVDFTGSSLAAVERTAEEHIARWRASLKATELEATEQALLLGWVRGAVYRAAADRVEAGQALPLLEEAAGGAARIRPGPGRDPWLLARIARARYVGGSPGQAAELLRDMAGQPRWGWLTPTAEACARVAVLPSPAVEGVRR